MLCQQSCFLLFHKVLDPGFLCALSLHLGELLVPLSFINDQLLLPQFLDVSLMLSFNHALFLLSHLFETFVLRELLHQLCFEFLLNPQFFESTLLLESHLELFRFLELSALTILFIDLCLLPRDRLQLALLVVQLVTQVLLKFFLLAALIFLSFQSFENFFAGLLSLVFGRLNLAESVLLLLGVPSDHFILVLVHLLLASEQGPFLIIGEDHVSLRLLHFEVLNACHFSVFINHALNHVVDLVTLPQVLHLCFRLFVFHRVDLALNCILVL